MNPADIVVRRMALNDIPRVLRVANQTFREMGRLPERFAHHTIHYMKTLPSWQLVAVFRERIIGFLVCGFMGCSWIDSAAEGSGKDEPRLTRRPDVFWVAAHPSYQRMGVGGRLLAAYEARCREHGFLDIRIGTPFATEFYLKQGYRPLDPVYRMVKELLEKPVEAPRGVESRIADLEDIDEILNNIPAEEGFPFVESFLSVYEREQDKCLILSAEEKIVGLLVAETDPHAFDLVRSLYEYAVDRKSYERLAEVFEYVCSKKGKRWAGMTPGDGESKRLLEARGWVESRLPSFWVGYRFEKRLD